MLGEGQRERSGDSRGMVVETVVCREDFTDNCLGQRTLVHTVCLCRKPRDAQPAYASRRTKTYISFVSLLKSIVPWTILSYPPAILSHSLVRSSAARTSSLPVISEISFSHLLTCVHGKRYSKNNEMVETSITDVEVEQTSSTSSTK